MENKHKNILIGGLLLVVFIMAVGFAGFSQRLTITEGSAITNSWNVGFSAATPSAVCAGADTTKCGTVATSIDTANGTTKTLTLNTKLFSPSDVVTYNVTVKNFGDVAAKIADGGIQMSTTNADSVIKYSQTGLTEGVTTVAAGATIEFTVTVTFENVEGTIDTSKLNNGLTLYIDWEQA